MKYYYDTSALCRHYHTEPGSDRVNALLLDATSQHVISRLTFVECQSALALMVRTNQITAEDFTQLRQCLRADVHARKLIVAQLFRRHFDVTESLLVRHGLSLRLRTLDALHIAIALDLLKSKTIDVLVSADTAMVTVARMEGLTVINPLEP